MAETLNCVSLLKKNKSKHLEYSRYLDKMQEFYSKKKQTEALNRYCWRFCYTYYNLFVGFLSNELL